MEGTGRRTILSSRRPHPLAIRHIRLAKGGRSRWPSSIRGGNLSYAVTQWSDCIIFSLCPSNINKYTSVQKDRNLRLWSESRSRQFHFFFCPPDRLLRSLSSSTCPYSSSTDAISTPVLIEFVSCCPISFPDSPSSGSSMHGILARFRDIQPDRIRSFPSFSTTTITRDESKKECINAWTCHRCSGLGKWTREPAAICIRARRASFHLCPWIFPGESTEYSSRFSRKRVPSLASTLSHRDEQQRTGRCRAQLRRKRRFWMAGRRGLQQFPSVSSDGRRKIERKRHACTHACR